jgi:hypothetical protein
VSICYVGYNLAILVYFLSNLVLCLIVGEVFLCSHGAWFRWYCHSFFPSLLLKHYFSVFLVLNFIFLIILLNMLILWGTRLWIFVFLFYFSLANLSKRFEFTFLLFFLRFTHIVVSYCFLNFFLLTLIRLNL